MAEVVIVIATQGAFSAGQWTAIKANSLAVKVYQDATVAEIQKRFPGTPSQTATQALALMTALLRAEVLNHVKNLRRASDQTTVDAGQVAEESSFNVNYPP